MGFNFKKLGQKISNFGSKMVNKVTTFGSKLPGQISQASAQVQNVTDKLAGGIEKAKKVVETVSKYDTTGITGKIAKGLDLASSATQGIGDIARAGGYLAEGNIKGAIEQGKEGVGQIKRTIQDVKDVVKVV